MPKKSSKTSKRKPKPRAKTNPNRKSNGTSSSISTPLELQNALDQLSTYVSTFYKALYNSPPDGSPFVQEEHILTQVYKKCLEGVQDVIKLQRNELNVQDVENSVQECQDTRHDKFVWNNFRDWLLEQGGVDLTKFPIQVRRLEGDNRSNEYGLFATRDIGYNETVLEIPSRLICSPFVEDYYNQGEKGDGNITTTSSSKHSTLEKEPELPRHLLLIAHLMNHQWKSKSSASNTSLNYKAYLDTLPPPSYYNDVNPLYWSYSEQVLLKQVGTSHLKRALLNQIQTIHDYLQIRKMMQERPSSRKTKDSCHGETTRRFLQGLDEGIPLSDFTLDSFVWATATIHSRQYRIQDSIKMTESPQEYSILDHSLVPLFDLLNHEDSDRACISNLSIESNESEKGENDGTTRSYNLVVQTPPSLKNCQEQENLPCFKCGEEVTLHYGERSSAQLFFDSGFLYYDIPKSEVQHNFRNLNRKDHFVLQLALPPVEMDEHDKVRELIAAKLGFRAYVDQGCDHDGKHISKLAGECMVRFGEYENKAESRTKKVQNKTARDEGCTLIKEIPVSVHDPCCEEVVAAMVLCVADRIELTQLLRNVTSGNGGENLSASLKLDERHVYLATQIIQHYKASSSYDENYETDLKKLGICERFKRCDDSTMRLWLDNFCNKAKN